MAQKNLYWRIFLITAVVAISFFYSYPPFDPDAAGPREGKIKLGLDLQGGMDLVLRVDTRDLAPKDREDATARAIEIVRNRIDQFGVAEPSIQRQGADRIAIQLPGITDRKRALELIGKTALLEFRLVSNEPALLSKAIGGEVPADYELSKTEDGESILIEKNAVITGKYIKDAAVNFGQYNEPEVSFEFNGEGGDLFAKLTGANIGRRLAIVLDGVVQSAPTIQSQISNRGVITGRFSYDQARDLSIVLRAGALPAPIIIEEERSVGANLGRDSVEKGIRAAVVGCALVIAFMVVYYLLAGLIADLALALNVLMTLAFLSYFHATLTLPGIAGAVLSVGMAVDTNVLVFERIREELALKKPLPSSVFAGYKKAFVTVLDSHLTTLITAAILYIIGTGPIRGFALTLAIGIVASMFTGIFVTHTLFDLLLVKGHLKNLPMMQFIHKTPNVNYLKFRKFCYAISLIVILVGAFAFVNRGKSMFGVDFSGGTMQEFKFEKPIEIDAIRKSLSEIGLGTAVIQRVGETNQIIIRSDMHTDEKISAHLNESFPDNSYEIRRIETVGPIVGGEMKSKAFYAFLFSLLAIWGFIAVRYDTRFAFGAILALFHDGLVALGAVALSGREISITVLAAVLTILGYSINDTIVIFDRIRERRRSGVRESLADTINTSLNQTLSRTILTSLTVFIVVLAMFFYGGEVINDFAFTMIIGLISGTYSTIYIAAPVLVDAPIGKRKG